MEILSAVLMFLGVTIYVIVFVTGVIKIAGRKRKVWSMRQDERDTSRRRSPSLSDHNRFLEKYVGCPWSGNAVQSRKRGEEDSEINYGSIDFRDPGEV